MTAPPTPAELADTLVTMLAGAASGPDAKWRKAIGAVEKLPTWANVRSNWRIMPTGSAADIATILEAARILREAHPYVAE